MNRTLRNGALALVLAGGAMLATAPAKANSIHDEDYFGGSWSRIGPGNYAEHRNAGRFGPLYGHRAYRYPMGQRLTPTGLLLAPLLLLRLRPTLIGGPGIGFSSGID